MVIRSAGLATGLTRPVAAAVNFLRPVPTGESVEIDIEFRSQGRRVEVLDVLMRAGEQSLVSARVTTATHDGPDNAPVLTNVDHPDARRPEDLPSSGERFEREGSPPLPPILHHIDWRDAPADEIPPSGPRDRRYLGWSRVEDRVFDDPFLEAARYAFALDNQVPTLAFASGWDGPPDMVRSGVLGTSLDITYHFHSTVPATPWIQSQSRATHAGDGLGHAVGHAWDANGRLLATSTGQVMFLSLPG